MRLYLLRLVFVGVGLLAFAGQASAQKALDFGLQPIFTPSPPQTVTFSNMGNGPLNILMVQTSGPQGNWFRTNALMLPLPVPAGGSVNIDVTALPLALGVGTGTLNILFDDPKVPSIAVPCKVEGVGASLNVDPADLEFGNVAVGKSKSMTITLSNVGKVSLTLQSASLLDPTMAGCFSMTGGGPMPDIVIAPGKFVRLTVTFKPSIVGRCTAELDLATDDPLARFVRVPIGGTGVAVVLRMSPTMLSFPATFVNAQSAPQSVAVQNASQLPVTFTGCDLTGADAAQFRSEDPGTFTVDGGKERTISVGYQPTQQGSHTATLSCAPIGFAPVQATLAGVSIAAALQATETSVDFGDVVVGTLTLPVAIGLRNTGAVALKITRIASSNPRFFVDTAQAMTSLDLQPGGVTRFYLYFKPDAISAMFATIGVTVDGLDTPFVTVDARGNGVSHLESDPASCSVSGRAASSSSMALGFVFTLVALAWRSRRRRGAGAPADFGPRIAALSPSECREGTRPGAPGAQPPGGSAGREAAVVVPGALEPGGCSLRGL